MLQRLFRRRTLVGIDIGSRVVKVVESRSAGRGRWEVVAQAEEPTSPGSYVGGQVFDAGSLAASVREAVRNGSVRGRRAVLAVPPQVGFIRRMAFPRMTLQELRAVIDLQPERYIPFARDGAIYDLHLTRGEAPEGQMWAVVAAAPRRWILEMMAVAGAAGLTTERVDLEPLALHRAAVATGHAAPNACTALVDMGAGVAKVSLFEGEVPVISRVLDLPPADPSLGSAGQNGIDDLFMDIRRSVEFALTQTATPPRSVLLTGGTGADIHTALALTGYLRGFLATRLPADFRVDVLHDANHTVPGARMLALGLSLPPEIFAS